ncbi:hypothetical protein [Candidatus Enterococcus ikei]|uniref:Regulatory protein YycH-like domain-containing protein n=1 Tax=Candidatus Enterococcus ikei TaxID=2815326 RepID=A0ABS3H480_9ENTE|nr:hypothetical protein [Enterococcus sp. DIV0869a]MBO0441953.1 hypothetical protein [Enterococcus sp. DIV0869a]
MKKEKKEWIKLLLQLFLLPIFIGMATFQANVAFSNKQNEENKKEVIKTITLGTSEEYINSIFDVPKYSFTESVELGDPPPLNEKKIPVTLKHNFYLVNDALVRVSFDSNTAISYFFFVLGNKSSLDLSPYTVTKIGLGKDSYKSIKKNSESEFINIVDNSPIDRTCSIIRTSSANNRSAIYYSEWYEFGQSTNYTNIVYGNIWNKTEKYADYQSLSFESKLLYDYSDLHDQVKSEMGIFELKGDDAFKLQSTIHKEYGNAIPNVYGLVHPKYNHVIDINSPKDKWNQVYSATN